MAGRKRMRHRPPPPPDPAAVAPERVRGLLCYGGDVGYTLAVAEGGEGGELTGRAMPWTKRNG